MRILNFFTIVSAALVSFSASAGTLNYQGTAVIAVNSTEIEREQLLKSLKKDSPQGDFDFMGSIDILIFNVPDEDAPKVSQILNTSKIVVSIEPGLQDKRLSSEIVVKLSPLKNIKGDVVFALYDNEKSYKDSSKPKTSGRFTVADKNTRFVISDMAAGNYALLVYQDENKNGKLDMGMFGPKEPYGFSRNPKIKFSGPKFQDIVFKVDGEKNLNLDIKLND